MLRKEQIALMMDKVVRIIDDLQGHTMDECLHMIAAAMGVLLLQEEDIQVREEILKELIRVIRSSVYDSMDEEIVYVDRVIEE